MSTIKSSDEHLTLNADGSSKDIKFQANGVEKASIDSSGNLTVSGNLTSVGIDDNADATAITIDSSERVGIGTGSPTQQLHSYNTNAHRLRVANANYGIDLHQPAGASSPHINAYGTDVAIIFDVNDSEKMRINSNGYVNVGTATNKGATKLTVESDTSVDNPMAVSNSRTGAATDYSILFYRAGSIVGSVQTSLSATSYVTSSDYRLKENVDYTWDATTRLKQLKPARFNWIADDTNTLVDGFIAHEVSSVVPEAVTGDKDAMIAEVLYAEGDELPEGKKVGDVKTAAEINPQGIDQAKLVPLLVKTIQELEARITALEA
jgi:hypothetical protein